MKMIVQYLTVLLTLLTLSSANPPQMCLKMSPCGADCYSTCDNPCQCDVTRRGQLPFPLYGGECRSTGFCETPSPTLEECVEKGGAKCPTEMLSEMEVMERLTQFDYRIDVRSDEEWKAGHVNISLHTPGLATIPAVNYQHVLQGKEESSVLVYCRSGRRAFSAALNLLRYGFSTVYSLHTGGYPTLSNTIMQHSLQDPTTSPTKALCYLTGGSSVCPTPLPLSHIPSSSYLLSLGDHVTLVDVRPKSYTESLDGAVRVYDKKRRIKKFLKTVEEKRDTLVLFCEKGILAFSVAKHFIKLGWQGRVYFVDNGGYNELRELFRRHY